MHVPALSLAANARLCSGLQEVEQRAYLQHYGSGLFFSLMVPLASLVARKVE
jgi:hypothetical protein